MSRDKLIMPHADEERVLRPSRKKMLLLFVVSLVFTAGGIMGIMRSGDPTSWLCTIFFGIGCVVFVMNSMPNASYLRLTPEGFEIKALFRKTFYEWGNIHNLQLIDVDSFERKVGFDLLNDPSSKLLRGVNKAVAGAQGCLPDTYGMKPPELLALMQFYWNVHAQSMYKRDLK